MRQQSDGDKIEPLAEEFLIDTIPANDALSKQWIMDMQMMMMMSFWKTIRA